MAKTHNVTLQCDFDSRYNYKRVKKVDSKGAYYCMYVVGTSSAIDDAFARSSHIPLGEKWLASMERNSDIEVIFKVGTFANGQTYTNGYGEEANGVKKRANTILMDVVRGSNTDHTTNLVHTMLEQNENLFAHLVMVWHSSFNKDEISEAEAEFKVSDHVGEKFCRVPHNKRFKKEQTPRQRRLKSYSIVY